MEETIQQNQVLMLDHATIPFLLKLEYTTLLHKITFFLWNFSLVARFEVFTAVKKEFLVSLVAVPCNMLIW